MGDVPWYVVTFVVPQNPTRPLWHGWSIETDGRSPWEAAQVAALDVLMDIAQSFGDELVGGPASSIPECLLLRLSGLRTLVKPWFEAVANGCRATTLE